MLKFVTAFRKNQTIDVEINTTGNQSKLQVITFPSYK
jgi:hypothetical protein